MAVSTAETSMRTFFFSICHRVWWRRLEEARPRSQPRSTRLP